jgi:SAM-dependent methyltransferase
MRIDDPEVVRTEYADEEGLAGRMAAYRFIEGPDARALLVDAVVDRRPRCVLDVGCGTGDLTARLGEATGADVLAVDQSERMVELTRARGVDAQVADVAELPFADGSFDCVVAAWMLFHASDIGSALAEIVRVLAPDGRLVAATNGMEHFSTLAELFGVRHEPLRFGSENGATLLAPYFAEIDRRDAFGWVVFPSRREAQDYVDASIAYRGCTLPDLEGPVRVRRAPTIFVADR